MPHVHGLCPRKYPKLSPSRLRFVLAELSKIKGFLVTESLFFVSSGNDETMASGDENRRVFSQIKAFVKRMEQRDECVVVPIVFGTNPDGTCSSDMLVCSHYSVLVVGPSRDPNIPDPRVVWYDPYEKNPVVENRLHRLIRTYTSLKLDTDPSSRRGLQYIMKDKEYCGHHVVYYILNDFATTLSPEKFVSFVKSFPTNNAAVYDHLLKFLK